MLVKRTSQPLHPGVLLPCSKSNCYQRHNCGQAVFQGTVCFDACPTRESDATHDWATNCASNISYSMWIPFNCK